MAKSAAKKKREHILRNTGKDIEQLRALSPEFSTHTRTTPTKVKKLSKSWGKHKKQCLNDIAF